MTALLDLLRGPLGLLVWLAAAGAGGLFAAFVLRKREASDAAPFLAAGVVALALLGDLAATAPGAGLAFWMGALPFASLLYPSDVALVSALTAAAMMPVGAMFAPRGERSGSPPLAWAPLALVAVGAVIVWPALGQRGASLAWIGLASCLPPAAATVAFAGIGRAAKVLTAAVQPQIPPTPAQPREADPTSAWQQLGATPAGSAPWFTSGGLRSTAPATRRWAEAGGAGAPPAELAIVEEARAGAVRLLLDTPGATLAVVMRALTVQAALERGERVLIIAPEGALVTADLESALPPGREPTVITVGLEPLRRALAAASPPTIAVLSPDELGNGGAGVLHPSAEPGRAAWAASLGWVMVPDVDRGDPLTLTHRLHALRRLHLALDASGVTAGVLASGASGGAALRLLQHAFSGRSIRAVTLTPADRPDVAVWLTDWRFVAAAADPWVLRVAKVTPGMHISDPLGLVPGGALDPSVARADATVGLTGRSSLAWLDAAGIASHILAVPQLVTTSARRHDALWALHDDPVTRMLQGEGNLQALVQRGRLQAPQAVIGAHNRSVARDHLRRALSDGPQRAAALRASFGPSLVDEVVGQRSIDAAFTARDRDGKVVRSALLPVGQPQERPVEASAVTDRVVEIVEAASGRTLRVVDEINATTRYYPRRIFRVGPDRFEVPLHAHDQRRARVEVVPVDRNLDATIPMLSVTLTAKEALVAPESIRRGPITFRLGTFDTVVEEVVHGVRRGRKAEVEYPEVRARYRTRARLLGFDRMASAAAMLHLGASLRQVMGAQLALDSEDVLVRPVSAGWWPEWPGGLVIADRHVQGAGLAEALDEHRVASLLDWVYAILHRCPCERGCPACSPAEILETGDLDKSGVIALLGG